jgi:hypothetical protein
MVIQVVRAEEPDLGPVGRRTDSSVSLIFGRSDRLYLKQRRGGLPQRIDVPPVRAHHLHPGRLGCYLRRSSA